ncbi:MAG: hypothetical protein D6696_05765 [Acidobacteria bacterium]|nr:MAG: hypothetical protein D6696_05765 [Acidobacteriota bacterium]
MKPRPTTVLYLILAVAAVGWAISRFGGDERRIHRRLDELRALIEKEGEESGFATARRAQRLGELFAGDFELDLAPYGLVVRDRGELARIFARYRAGPEQIRLRFRRPAIDLGAGGRHATVTLVAAVTARWPDRLGREAYRLELRLVDDGAWRIQHLELLEVLDGPDWL